MRSFLVQKMQKFHHAMYEVEWTVLAEITRSKNSPFRRFSFLVCSPIIPIGLVLRA
jgi:hypothetical protein